MGGSLSARRNVPNGLLLLGLALLAAVAAFPAGNAGAADLFLADEPEVYAALDKLNAAGLLPGFAANTRPYTLRAVRAAVEEAARTRIDDPADLETVGFLAEYLGSGAHARIAGEAAHANRRSVPPYDDGVTRPDGWSFRPSIFLREERSPAVSAQLRAKSFFGEGGDDGNRLLDASIEAGGDAASIVVGKFSSWYGPGRHGALILTNNAAPYPGVRIHSPRPIRLPGIFSFLGTGRYDLFVARMEKRALRSHSLLVGTRLSARPSTALEIGLSRTLHYGGDGSSDGLSELWREYWADDDRPEHGSKITGYDITLTVPNRRQPFQAYWERAGEGTGHLLGTGIHWPSAWANLVGLYLPKVLSLSRLDVRAEYSDSFSGTAKNADWYDHPVYPHRYRGEVLGDAVGGRAVDWFFESRYFIRPQSFVSLSYERLTHKSVTPPAGLALPEERHEVYGAGVVAWFSKTVRAEAKGSFDRVANEGKVAGADGTGYTLSLSLAYQEQPQAQAAPGLLR